MGEGKNKILAKLDEMEKRYIEIEKQIADTAVASDSAKLIELSQLLILKMQNRY
jgi:protein subunit release factor A